MPPASINELFGIVESSAFFLEFNLANDVAWLRQFFIHSNSATARLILYVRADASHAARIVDEVAELLQVDTDPAELHPYDAAIAAYLLVLEASNLEALKCALGLVRNAHPPNLWWTYRAYNHLLLLLPRETTMRSPAEFASYVEGEAGRARFEGASEETPTDTKRGCISLG